MLYLCNYPITRFRLEIGSKWNRTTVGDNTVPGLVTITVLILQVIAMQIFIAFPGRPELRSNQQNPGVPKEHTQLYLIQARAVDHWWYKCQTSSVHVTLSCV